LKAPCCHGASKELATRWLACLTGRASHPLDYCYLARPHSRFDPDLHDLSFIVFPIWYSFHCDTSVYDFSLTLVYTFSNIPQLLIYPCEWV
ncbi:MAG: hypothetical protein KJ826_13850, partial [Proteobacteria bacterium]|nr:hypothetical protein [Pseudomonadota bacterium]